MLILNKNAVNTRLYFYLIYIKQNNLLLKNVLGNSGK